ncbi:hypothetical protein ACFFK0_11730 [Paenibacillus chartarius]|uniref:Uncharacterized protein n=1 Tax=Paenibacillus chartarius TaxID=747481 RepID=A0ABV6DKD4_9BACL
MKDDQAFIEYGKDSVILWDVIALSNEQFLKGGFLAEILLKGFLSIYNVWDKGRGRQSWHYQS